jgi:hypothetical protein
MGNVEFSRNGLSIKKNRALVDHLVERMRNLTPEEKASGEIEVTLKKGDDVRTYKFVINRTIQLEQKRKAELSNNYQPQPM